MPIKFEELQNTQLFIEQNGEFKSLGSIPGSELIAEPLTPTPEQEYYAYFSSDPIEFTAKIAGNLRAWDIFIKTGNDLYLRFPKKLRRRRR